MRNRFMVVGLLSALTLAACSNPKGDDPQVATHSDIVGVARGRVDVEGGLLPIGATRDGIVSEVKAKEGDTVRQGDILAQLDTRPFDLAVAAAQAELAQATAQEHVLSARLAPAEQQSKRLTEAAGDGAATGQSADDARNAVAELKAQIEAADSGVELARQHLAAAQYERDQASLRAPVGGRIVVRNLQVGERVSAQSGKELFRLMPERPLIVQAELGEAFVDAVHPGMHAEVLPDASPGTPLQAHVVRIGQVFGAATRSDDPQQSPDARVVECVLALDGGSLRIGQQVLVRIHKQ